MINHFDVNVNGRDFVIGDLHGRFDLVKKFVTEHMDVAVDRVFSVGDLIDRGSESFKCLRLIEEPWFFCVKGNHEQLMEDWMTGGPTGPWWFHNGGGWFYDLNETEKHSLHEEWLPTVQKLPWLITVDKRDGGKFHILHAELPDVAGITDETLACETAVQKFLLHRMGDGEAGIWGRDLWGYLYGVDITDHQLAKLRRGFAISSPQQFNDKLSTIFSGHTTMRRPTKILGQVNLDTGAFREGSSKSPWACLTVTEPETNRFWRVDSDGIEEVELLVIV